MPKEKIFKLDQVAIRMVKEPPLLSDKPMDSPETAIEVMRDVFRDYDREILCVVNLKSNLQPISLNIASIGAVEQAIAHPRELLKSAILSNAASVILMHLHPSGNLEPSKQDISMTDRMQQAFTLMGIGIIDHIIMGDGDRYFSFREKREMPVGEPHYTSELAEVDLKKAYPLTKESVLDRLQGAKKESQNPEARTPRNRKSKGRESPGR